MRKIAILSLLIMLLTISSAFQQTSLHSQSVFAQDDATPTLTLTPVPTLEGISIYGTPQPSPTPNAVAIYDFLPQLGILAGQVQQFTNIISTEDTLSLDETVSALASRYPEQAELFPSLGASYRAAGVLGTHERILLAESCEGLAIFGIGSWLRLLPGESSAKELFKNPLTAELYSSAFGWKVEGEHDLPGNLYTVRAPSEFCSIPSMIYILDYQFGPMLLAISIYVPNTTPRETVLQTFPSLIDNINERIASRLGISASSIKPSHESTDVNKPEAGNESDSQIETCSNAFDVPMISIPQITFFMGLADEQPGPTNERPGHKVTVGAFCIDTFEVTNARYISCANEGACTPPQRTDSNLFREYYDSPSHARFPVINLTWEQAQAYCEHRGGRLPTEAEWELVARYDPVTGEVYSYPWGNQSPDATRANFDGMIGDAVEVGQHPQGVSFYGVHDLSGNVAEWIYDWYGPYSRDGNENPTGPVEGTARVVRGGSYDDTAEEIRGGGRSSQSPQVPSNQIGFRCVISQ